MALLGAGHTNDSKFTLVQNHADLISVWIFLVQNKIQDATGEKLSTFYLFQSILIAIQQGKAVCVMGCQKDTSSGLKVLFNFEVHEAEGLP